MAYNAKILSKARENIARRHEENLAEQTRRIGRVYARLPRVKEIDSELRSQMAELCALAVSRDAGAQEKIAALRDANLRLQSERDAILERAGLGAGYLDDIYSCRICRDTGYAGAAMCDCLKREYKAELTRELSGLLRDGGETFADFRADFYSAEPDSSGVPPREVMKFVYNYCREYAAKFSSASPSLLFRGGPGLGKTFLSACIAREVASNGFSVAYESAPKALGEFETQRFSRDEAERDAAAEKVRDYLECDLMILDDLGTEMTTSFTVSALYQLVNTRLTESRQTIISTNLSDEELLRRYGPQTASRLAGEYELLSFAGSDIRRIKKERGL